MVEPLQYVVQAHSVALLALALPGNACDVAHAR